MTVYFETVGKFTAQMVLWCSVGNLCTIQQTVMFVVKYIAVWIYIDGYLSIYIYPVDRYGSTTMQQDFFNPRYIQS